MVSFVFPTAVGPVMTRSVFLTDDTSLGVFYERADVFHLLAVRIDGTGLGNAVLQHALGIDNAVGIVDGLDCLVTETTAAQSDEVHTSVTHRLLAGDDVGGNVLTGACAALEHDVASDVQELVEQTGGADDGTVIDDDLTGKLGGVADDASVANDAVVANVHVLHQQVTVAYNGLALRGGASADGDVLADGVVVANFTGGILALELQVLGLGGYAGTGEELVAVANACTIVDGDIIQELIVITNDNVLVDDAEGTDDVAVAELCLGVNHC